MENFYWYDYETWGSDPWMDRPAQFAGVRTDINLNVIGDPVEIYCKPPSDLLPHPEACLTHGITPQVAEERGISEYQFSTIIHQQFAQPETCVVGFNNIKFDDEVTRHIFYRNFYDSYEREYKNGNSRWDILKLVRACYALRPEGIRWPIVEGKVSFKLENLTAENGITHKAHAALSDVFATLDLARLIKEKQPKLFNYFLKLRKKDEVLRYIDLNTKKPILHISGVFSVNRRCAALVMPLVRHPDPKKKNEIICYDLSIDPAPFIELSPEVIRERIFSTNERLKDLGMERVPLKSIRINQCPVICDNSVLNDESIAQRLQIDRAICKSNHEKILMMKNLADKINAIYQYTPKEENDPEKLLYRNFPPDADKILIQQIRTLDKYELAKRQFHFIDDRFPELLFRYRARNFPDTLSKSEKLKWHQFCYYRITDPSAGANIVADIYKEALSRLDAENYQDEKRREILFQLRQYIEGLLSNLKVGL